MKKLMFAAVAAMLGVAANAATIQWGTSNSGLLNPDGSEAMGEGYITMYLFSIDSTAYGKLIQGGEAGVSAAVWNTYGSQLASATDTYADDGMGQIAIADPATYTTGDTAYSAIILTYNDGSGISHYKANAGAYYLEADIATTIAEMDTFVGGEAGSMSTAISWTAVENVPEPTSGLLLLLGVAGLALRRRRA